MHQKIFGERFAVSAFPTRAIRSSEVDPRILKRPGWRLVASPVCRTPSGSDCAVITRVISKWNRLSDYYARPGGGSRWRARGKGSRCTKETLPLFDENLSNACNAKLVLETEPFGRFRRRANPPTSRSACASPRPGPRSLSQARPKRSWSAPAKDLCPPPICLLVTGPWSSPSDPPLCAPAGTSPQTRVLIWDQLFTKTRRWEKDAITGAGSHDLPRKLRDLQRKLSLRSGWKRTHWFKILPLWSACMEPFFALSSCAKYFCRSEGADHNFAVTILFFFAHSVLWERCHQQHGKLLCEFQPAKYEYKIVSSETQPQFSLHVSTQTKTSLRPVLQVP